MQCTPQANSRCSDCYVCTKSFPGKALNLGSMFRPCVEYGHVSIRAEIGPGEAISAVTYRQWPEMKTKD